MGRRPVGSASSSRPAPPAAGVIPFRSGVILTPVASVRAPLGSVLPPALNASGLSLILSLCVHRYNGAFLFSALNRDGGVQLAVRPAPGRLLVRVGRNPPAEFPYDLYDGRWHSLGVAVRGRSVVLHTSCGQKSLHADLRSRYEEALDPQGSFFLGKMDHGSVPFEGAVCQFDIYPSAEAAHNYCDYIKKQCREADTYRPALPPLLPLFSDPNITVANQTPRPLTAKSSKAETATLAPTWENTRTTIPPFRMVKRSTVNPPKPAATSGSPPPYPGLESPYYSPTQTVTASLGISMTSPSPKKKSQAKRGNTDSPKAFGKSTRSPASTRSQRMEPQGASVSHNEQLTKPEPKATGARDFRPTSLIPVTPPATDGFQTFDLEPTQFSLLAGPPGLKGEPGPPVSESALDKHDKKPVPDTPG
ncbi:unnamed protein product [Menidia menidia]|uniref:(Atlantic silverside) hypothetical protein n=1 Tax=Menidia menidia TaxID=238744 RepID=A0A8S4B7E1_9TELE|nr:unnamed protein product [Menidia menidia]